MNLSAPFIQRPIMTTLTMIAVLLAGFLAYSRLPISNLPNVTFPSITVSVSFPGMSPDMMAQAVALPLEKQFMAIPGVNLVSSNNTLGSSSIVLQFDVSKDMTEAAQDVQSAIIAATPQLPPQLPYAPTYRKQNPAELPILYIALTSETMRLNELYTYANNFVGQRLSMLSGVAQVNVFGSPLAIRIQVDPAKLVANDLSLNELAAAIATGNSNLPTGQLDGLIDAPNISVEGQLITKEGWNNLIAVYRNGTPLRVKDLGEAVESFQNDKINVKYLKNGNAQPAIILAIQKEPSGNVVEISDAIHALVTQLETELPAAVKIETFFDQSELVRESITEMKFTLLLALVLVVFVIAIYLRNLIDTVIPSLVIPMAVIGTFVVMDQLNFSLDNLSLLALTLAIGFIIDDAIVVLENIVRRQEEGEDRYQASMEGASQIGFTIISMTLSLIAVFIPMLFMGSLIGRIFREFAITLACVTIISGLISMTLTPMLCSRFLPKKRDMMPKKKKFFLFEWSHAFNENIKARYGQTLVKVIDHEKTALFVGVICLLLTLFLFTYLPVDFVPDEDGGFFIVYAQSQEAGSSSRMLEYEKEINEVLSSHPSVDSVVAMSSYSEYRKAQNLVLLKPRHDRPPLKEVARDLNKQFFAIAGVQTFIKNIPLIDLSTGQESRGNYQISLRSLFPEKVYSSAKALISKMQKERTIFRDVSSDLEIDSPQVNVKILRDKASSLGLTAADIENAFNFSYSYNFITRIDTQVDQYNVILELLKKEQRSPQTFNLLWMRSNISEKLVPMSAVAIWEEALGASSVNHVNQFASVTINFNLAPKIALDRALERIDEIKGEVVDSKVVLQPIGAISAFQESVESAGFLILVAIISVYIILGMLYESFIHPLTVLSTLPPATLGGLITLWLFNFPLSMYSFLGIILLIGIVQKNGIMMIDFTLENIRVRKMPPREAILDACLTRFRPIMMTTVAAIAGALPIALGFGAGAEARRPLGFVIVGGLMFSQLITLFLTPILYLVLEKVNRRIPWH